LVEKWTGIVPEVLNRLSTHASHNVIDRQGDNFTVHIFDVNHFIFNFNFPTGRYDVKLPNFLVEKLNLPSLLQPILERLTTIMGTPTPQIKTHDIVFAPVGSDAQQWHADDSITRHKLHRYFTVLIQLNTLDENCGGTEIYSYQSKKSDLVSCSFSIILPKHFCGCPFTNICVSVI
jgi:hypothetical protein